MTFVKISILLFFLFGPLVIYGPVDGPIPMHIKATLSGPSGLWRERTHEIDKVRRIEKRLEEGW